MFGSGCLLIMRNAGDIAPYSIYGQDCGIVYYRCLLFMWIPHLFSIALRIWMDCLLHENSTEVHVKRWFMLDSVFIDVF